MKTNILLRVIAAVSLLTVVSCSREMDLDVLQNTYTVSILAEKGEPDTRALSLDGNVLNAAWARGEVVKVYNKTKDADLEGSLVAQGDGASTTLAGQITGTVEAGDVLTLKFLTPDYGNQPGTLEYIAGHCDYATADVEVKGISDGNLSTDNATFVNQQSIVEFTLKEGDGAAIAGGVSSLIVTLTEAATTITVTPGSPTDVLYVAVPAVDNGSIKMEATVNDGTRRFFSRSGAEFAKGRYYRIGVKMAFLVTTEIELRSANAAKYAKIALGADITLAEGEVSVSDAMTLDLNGHTLSGGNRSRIFNVPSGKSLTITGEGTLTGGNASDGNGGAIYNMGTLTIHGGTITGNTAGGKGGGIYNAYRSGNPAVLNLSGSTVISGNGNGNLYLEEGTVINVDGAFSSGASIGVTMAGGRGVFTSGYSTCNGSADPSAVFSADGGNYMVAFSGSEAAMSLYYHYVSQKSYSNLQVLLNETGLLGAVSPMVVQMMMAVYFPDNGVPVSAISYTYRSTDPQGDPVELSALLYVPNAALSGTKLTGITLACHGTIAKKTQCPTMTAQFEGVIAWKNHAVVMPDYYGFGASADRPQGYLDAENTAHNSIDAYLAAVQLLEDRGVTIPQKLYSFGYSQGGFNSMANLRYVAQHPELGISFDKVFCGGSPFDVMGTWNEYTNGSFNNSLAFVPMTLVSINETHKLGLSYSDLFKGALLNNWQNWILSKNYTTTEISNLLISNGQSTISGILTDDMVAGTGAAFNSIRSVCESYSLISGWTPPSGRKYIFIYHSKDDDTVPYANLTAMKSFLDRTAPGSYTLYDGNDGGHTSAAVSFVQNIIKEW